MVTKRKSSGLLRIVEERLLMKKIEEEKKQTQVSYIPKDCISNILVRLPADSLQRSRFVCKPWYNVVKNPKFIDAHLHRSESVLIFLSPNVKESLYPISKKTKVGEKDRSYPFPTTSGSQVKPNTVSVESKLLDPNSIPIFGLPTLNSTKSFVQFLEFKNGKSEIGEYSLSCLGNIRATCNGLILLDNKLKKGGVIVMNPVTKKLIALPLGTLCHLPHQESYGFALSDLTGEYKVVHLFRDQLGFVGCEIFSLYKKAWREVNGPSFGLFGNKGFGYAPVSAIGALHWIPHFDRSNYIVSMEVDKEKFHQMPLPKGCRIHDRIIEIGGFLGFVTHEGMNQIDIWILKGLCGEVWTKNHSITVDSKIDMVPLCSLRIKGDIIFNRNKDGSFYAYDFQQQKMTEVGMIKGLPRSSVTYLSHVNSLVSWMQADEDMFP